ncbi:hypothetical protein [uncultured Salinisphaera sp.]|uniref:hypothetical protein n=1 Tax=uncultured Salinisphaera sp. TaxID=359372 RepID=UPI0032B278B1
MTRLNQVIKGLGYIATRESAGYAVTFDPGSHKPQEVTVKLTAEEFAAIQNDPSSFHKIVVAAMERQQIRVE